MYLKWGQKWKAKQRAETLSKALKTKHPEHR